MPRGDRRAGGGDGGDRVHPAGLAGGRAGAHSRRARQDLVGGASYRRVQRAIGGRRHARAPHRGARRPVAHGEAAVRRRGLPQGRRRHGAGKARGGLAASPTIKEMHMPDAAKSGLVVTAHPGDFVWRAGGAIALHARKGYAMTIACLSYGERGESQWAWKKAGVSLEEVKAQRRDEAERAAALLGASIVFFDAGDYPLRSTPEMLDRLIDIYRETRPSFVLTHALEDP